MKKTDACGGGRDLGGFSSELVDEGNSLKDYVDSPSRVMSFRVLVDSLLEVVHETTS